LDLDGEHAERLCDLGAAVHVPQEEQHFFFCLVTLKSRLLDTTIYEP
jgi:hypothetical protein